MYTFVNIQTINTHQNLKKMVNKININLLTPKCKILKINIISVEKVLTYQHKNIKIHNKI